ARAPGARRTASTSDSAGSRSTHARRTLRAIAAAFGRPTCREGHPSASDPKHHTRARVRWCHLEWKGRYRRDLTFQKHQVALKLTFFFSVRCRSLSPFKGREP